MSLDAFLAWLAGQHWAQVISEGWGFPFLEALHVTGLALLIGSIGILDLRLLNLTGRSLRVTTLTKAVVPWTWSGFGLAVVTGLLIFAGAADRYAHNPAFQAKMALLLLAGANMAVFQFWCWKSVAEWDVGLPSMAARIAGGLSLLFWCAVVFAARMIAVM